MEYTTHTYLMLSSLLALFYARLSPTIWESDESTIYQLKYCTFKVMTSSVCYAICLSFRVTSYHNVYPIMLYKRSFNYTMPGLSSGCVAASWAAAFPAFRPKTAPAVSPLPPG